MSATSSSLRPWLLWLLVLLILLASVAVPVLIPKCSPLPVPPPPEAPHDYPDNTADLAPWLTVRLPRVRDIAIPESDNFYLVSDAVSPEIEAADLDQLPRRAVDISKWKGVVYVAKTFFDPRLYDRSDAGEYGFTAPPFMFFGDPNLLRKIQGAMEGNKERLPVSDSLAGNENGKDGS